MFGPRGFSSTGRLMELDPFLAGFIALGVVFGVAMTLCCDIPRWRRLAKEKKEGKENEMISKNRLQLSS